MVLTRSSSGQPRSCILYCSKKNQGSEYNTIKTYSKTVNLVQTAYIIVSVVYHIIELNKCIDQFYSVLSSTLTTQMIHFKLPYTNVFAVNYVILHHFKYA